ncbi:MAG: hypothetical protein LBU09_04940, partial [Endomicrobium sp.]|nr:hypothetical protein [Endomicrobium sp.]
MLKKIISILISCGILLTLAADALCLQNGQNFRSVGGFEILKNFKIMNLSYKPDSHLVIFINDIHCNAKAQKIVYDALTNLSDAKMLSAVFAEGAPAGKIDVSNHDKKRKQITGVFLESGLVSGAEAFCVKTDFKNFYGIEERGVYVKNLEIAARKYNDGAPT